MNPERWQEVRRVFAVLHRRDPHFQQEELDRLAAQDPELASELRSLLRHDHAAQAEGYLQDPPEPGHNGSLPHPLDQLPEGTRIGPYQILGLLGEGGMGAVYLAVRVEDYQQQVALKLIASHLTRETLRRFHTERQLLADLEHPNIVRLLDGGLTASGVPYLVMEYVPGEALDAYCDRLKLPVVEQARLVELVARAIAYAHEQGVVHRDLKPSNVLVTADGTPKVTDFGLARSVARVDCASATGSGVFPGTPGYMAPEQITGGPGRNLPSIDCYSLGAILYRLLANHPPFDAETPLQVCLRATTETAPSVRCLDPRIPRDLDTIVARAMARDPAERITSVNELADQLRRFLDGRPLTIEPFTPWNWLGKWASKHRKGLLAWGASVGVLLLTLVGVLVAANLRARAQLETMEGLFRSATLAGEDLSEVLPLGSDRAHGFFEQMVGLCERALADFPASGTKGELRYRAALAHHHLARSLEARDPQNNHAEVLRHFDRAVTLLTELVRDHPREQWYRYDLFRSLSFRGEAHRRATDHDRAEVDARASLRVIEALARDVPTNPDWRDAVAFQHQKLGVNLLDQGRYGEADDEANRALEIAAQLVEALPERTSYQNNLIRGLHLRADVQRDTGRSDEEVISRREALEIQSRLVRLDPENHHTQAGELNAQYSLAVALRRQGELDEAVTLLAVALDTVREQARVYPHDRSRGDLRLLLESELERVQAEKARREEAE